MQHATRLAPMAGPDGPPVEPCRTGPRSGALLRSVGDALAVPHGHAEAVLAEAMRRADPLAMVAPTGSNAAPQSDADFLNACREALEEVADLRQCLLERQLELAERDVEQAEVVDLLRRQLQDTRAGAEAAYADLLARLGEGPLPPLPRAGNGDAGRAEVEAMLNSTSWRITAPLRRMVDLLRLMKRRLGRH